MGENKEAILIIVILFILFGLAYGPIKNSSLQKSSGTNNSKTSSKDSVISTGETSTDSKSSTISKEDIVDTIKETESEIEKINKDLQKQIEENRRSPYYNKIRMSNISNRNNSDPNKEYIRLSTSLKEGEGVNITGWYFRSEVTGNRITIGKASLLPFPFTRNDSDVILERGDSAIITKGFSPIGISFRTNSCTGYFEENRTFYPSLSRQCPRPYYDEELPRFSYLEERNDECLNLIKKIPRCTTRNSEYMRDLPDTVTSSCKDYIRNQVNYNSCVAKHFGDTDFPGKEYRIYIGKFGTLWKKEREKINLHDNNGLVVDTISY